MSVAFDARFCITFRYQRRAHEVESFEIPAKNFFDRDVESAYEPAEWGCDLPWEKIQVEAYLPEQARERKDLVWLQLDIQDLLLGTHRRLLVQYWHGHRLLCDWNNLARDNTLSQLMLEVVECDASTQHLKLAIDQRHVRIVSHNRIRDAADELEWFDVPTAPPID